MQGTREKVPLIQWTCSREPATDSVKSSRSCWWFLNPFVRIYTYEIPKPWRLLYVYIRTRTSRSKYGALPASKRHFTVSPHEVFTWFRSAAGSRFIACLPTEEKWSLVGVVRCLWRVLENYACRTKFKSSLGMEYNGKLYGFSAVKVKLVDSLIWRPFIPGRRWQDDLTHVQVFYFEQFVL